MNLRPRIAILISGRGSNMQALLAQKLQIPADFVLVLSDRADAPGLLIARNQGTEVVIVEREKGQNKAAHEAEMVKVLHAAGITHLALAGFMRILSEDFIAQFDAVFNIHPSLLPAFPGLNTHARALSSGAKTHGCTVHQVDGGVDTGPIMAQAGLDIRMNETEDSLGERVLQLEHRLYTAALRTFFLGAESNGSLG